MSSNTSRPRTPPPSSYSNSRSAKPPPPARTGSGLSSPPSRRTYADFISYTKDDWNADDDEDEGELTYDNNDEDEFGLPSLASIRRNSKPLPTQKGKDPEGGFSAQINGTPSLGIGLTAARRRANSADIAEERGPPSYPTAKKSEGKILRPQYKDILKGKAQHSSNRRRLLKLQNQTQQMHCT